MDFSSRQAGATRQQSRSPKGADQTAEAFEKSAEQDDLAVAPIEEAEELLEQVESGKRSWKDFFKGDEDDG